MNHMLHGAVARIGGAIKRIEGADGAKYSSGIECCITSLFSLLNSNRKSSTEFIS